MSTGFEKWTALLIEDEAYFRRFVGRVLQQLTVGSVIEARDGREGVELFEAKSPDLVLLDISMPHMDGVKTLAELRKRAQKTPIVMLTSVAEENVVEECVKEGATFFIRKDVPADQLAAAISGVLKGLAETRGAS